jgi:hypothetical protein
MDVSSRKDLDMSIKQEWIARWRSATGSAWHPSAYKADYRNDGKPTVVVRLNLDRDRSRTVELVLDADDAVKLGEYLVTQGNRASEQGSIS